MVIVVASWEREHRAQAGRARDRDHDARCLHEFDGVPVAEVNSATEVIHLVAHAEAHPRITWLTVTGAEGNLWLLGDSPCSSGTCLAMFESENGGESFVRVGVPPVRAGFFGTQAVITPRGLPTGSLLFANREDGYADSERWTNGRGQFLLDR